jgi:Ca2+-binding EF-hand superfamily protein
MIRAFAFISAWCSLILSLGLAATRATAAPQPRPRQQVMQLLRGSAEDFIKHFDKNKDGVLTKDELPPFLTRMFARIDTNGDGQLDRQEIAVLMQRLRQQFRKNNNNFQPRPQQIEKVINNILQRMDTDKDGKISRKEARGRVAQLFKQLDTNNDGFVDKQELRQLAVRILANRGNGAGGGGRGTGPQNGRPDFDALDLNADGRLTRAELKGTRFADVFDQIDKNKDGKIDRKEFEAYLKKIGQ